MAETQWSESVAGSRHLGGRTSSCMGRSEASTGHPEAIASRGGLRNPTETPGYRTASACWNAAATCSQSILPDPIRNRSRSSRTSSGTKEITSLTNCARHRGSFSPTETIRHFPSSPESPSMLRGLGFLLGSQNSSSIESRTSTHRVSGNIPLASSMVLSEEQRSMSARSMPSLHEPRSRALAEGGNLSPRGTGTSPASIALGRWSYRSWTDTTNGTDAPFEGTM